MSKMTRALCALGVVSASIAGGIATAATSNAATSQTYIHTVHGFTTAADCNNHAQWYVNQIAATSGEKMTKSYAMDNTIGYSGPGRCAITQDGSYAYGVEYTGPNAMNGDPVLSSAAGQTAAKGMTYNTYELYWTSANMKGDQFAACDSVGNVVPKNINGSKSPLAYVINNGQCTGEPVIARQVVYNAAKPLTTVAAMGSVSYGAQTGNYLLGTDNSYTGASTINIAPGS